MSTEEDWEEWARDQAGSWLPSGRFERWLTPEDKRKARDKARKAERAGLPKRKKVQYKPYLIPSEEYDPPEYTRRKTLLGDITAGLKRGELLQTRGLPVEYIPYIDLPKPALDTIKGLAYYLDIEWDEEIHTITGALKTYREQRYGDAAPVLGILRGTMPDGTIVWLRRKTGWKGTTALIVGDKVYANAHALLRKLKHGDNDPGGFLHELEPEVIEEIDKRVQGFVLDPFRDIKSGFTEDMFNLPPGDYKDED